MDLQLFLDRLAAGRRADERDRCFLARAELLELSREHPDRQSLGLLVATWARVGYPIYPTPTSLRILNRTVARLIATPGACDQVPDQLASIAHAYLDSGACAKAADLIDALDSACVAPKSRWFVEDIKRRLAWERIPDLPMEKPCAAQTAAI